MLRVLTLVLALAALSAQPSGIVIVNARVFTGLASRPWVEAIRIDGERVVLIGTAEEVRRGAGAARVIDAGGRLVVPGFNDAHVHVSAVPAHVAIEAPPAMEEDPAWDVMLRRVEAAAAKAPSGGWVLGEFSGRISDDPGATRFALDAVSGGRPVMLSAWHGHGMLLNTAALRRLDIPDTEADPPGGFYGRMPDGRTLNGVAHEYACYRIARRFAQLAGPEAQVKEYQRFAARAASLGVTSVQAMMVSYPAAEAVPLFAKADLPIRVRVIDFPFDFDAWTAAPAQSPSMRVMPSGVKVILDGTPFERLMLLREPYSDAPSTRGRLNIPPDQLRALLARAAARMTQPMFHAVGDAAIDAVLDALESAATEPGAAARIWQPLRPRIEHGDMFEPAHFERAKRLGVVLVQNPSHFMVADTFAARIGDRLKRATTVKSIVAAGVPLAFGSDGPLNPFLNIMFATINAVNPSEALTVEQAVVAYTRGAAYAERMEGQKGQLAPGMYADLAMLSQDIFRIPPAELPKTTSVLTIVGGRIVHEAR